MTVLLLYAMSDKVETESGKEPENKDTKEKTSEPKDGEKEAGDGKKKQGVEKPEGLTPEVENYINSQAAAARRSGEESARKKLEAENAKKEEERLRAEEVAKGDKDALIKRLTDSETSLKAEKAEAESKLRRISAAVTAGIPEPEKNYLRLIDDEDPEKVLADAKELKKSFFGAFRKTEDNPGTPDGKGGKDDGKAKKGDLDQKAVEGQAALGMYNSF